MADNIKVVIKVRPLIKREIDDHLQKQWAVSENTIYQIEQPSKDIFTFDYVFDDTSLTRDVYDKVARPIVEAAVGGINGTIFAYGQTSSGKTYTMMGDAASPGVIPMAISNIFESIESKVDRDFLLRVSYIEIYNEKLRDLLDLNNVDLKIHESYNSQVSVTCKEEVASKPEQVLELMRKGNRNRSTGETQMNERSSRSHTIFIIIIESRRHVSPGEEEENCVNVSQLNLVDLAGSERAGQTGATRQRLREGGHINKSLSTLGNVIRQLADAEGDTTRFISFRDSKLTRILQTSLGGNAKTGIICAVTPAALDETNSTLMFAACAKTIENKPKINAVMSDATQIKRLTKEMRTLQEELESKKHVEVVNKELQLQLAVLREKIMMGNSEPDSVQRSAALRRRTWCAPVSSLAPILENSSQPNLLWNRNKYKVNRLSNVTERDDDSTIGSRDSTSSRRVSDTPHGCKPLEDVICLDDSSESVSTRCRTPDGCSPDHKCFETHHTPPCLLRYRAHNAEKELKEIEELTKLEKIYASSELELLNHNTFLRTQQERMQSEKKASEEKCRQYEREIEELQCNLQICNNERDEAIKLEKQLLEQVNFVKSTNTDLEYQIDELKIRTQNREKELLSSLKEARQEKDVLHKNQRNSLVPQFLNMSRDISLLSNTGISECESDEHLKLQNIISVKDNIIADLQKAIEQSKTETDASKLESTEKLTRINAAGARGIEKCDIFCQQTEHYLELKTQFENVSCQLETTNTKLSKLTEENVIIPTYKKEIEELKDKITNMENVNMSSRPPNYQDELTELKSLITDLKNQLSCYKQQIADKDLCIQKELEIRYIIETDNFNLKDNIIVLRNEITKLKEEFRVLENDRNEGLLISLSQKTEIDKLTIDLGDLNAQFSLISRKNEELQKRLENVNTENASLIQNMHQTIAQLNENLKDSESVCKEVQIKFESDKLHFESVENEKSLEITHLNKCLVEVQKNVEELEATIESQKNSSHQKMIGDNIELQEAVLKYDTLYQENTKTKAENISLSENIKFLTAQSSNEISVLNDQLNSHLMELNNVKAENKDLSQIILQLQGDLQSELDSTRKLLLDISNLKLKENSLADECIIIKTENINLTKKNCQLHTDLNAKVCEISNLMEEMNSLTEELNSFKAELKKIYSEKDEMTKSILQLEETLIIKNNEIDQLLLNIDSAKNKVDALNSVQLENISLSNQNVQLQNEVQMKIDAINKLSIVNDESIFSATEIADSKSKNGTLEHLLQLQEKFADVQKENCQLLEEISDIKSEKDKLSEEVTALQSKLKTKSKDISTLLEEISYFKNAVDPPLLGGFPNETSKYGGNNLESQLELQNIQKLLSQISTISLFLKENKHFNSHCSENQDSVEIIVESENKDIIYICNVLSSLKSYISSMEPLKQEHSDYKSELSKLKSIIETQKEDVLKCKSLNKEYEGLYLIKDSFDNKENVDNSYSAVSPLRSKKDDFISSESQFCISPYNISFQNIPKVKDSPKIGKMKSSPLKVKIDAKKMLEVIQNYVTSNDISWENIFPTDIPELKIVLEKVRKLKIELVSSLKAHSSLMEKVLDLENINNNLKSVLHNVYIGVSKLEQINCDKYSDGDITFTGGTVDNCMDRLRNSINDIVSMKSLMKQSLNCEITEANDSSVFDENISNTSVIMGKKPAPETVEINGEKICFSMEEASPSSDFENLENFLFFLESSISEAYSQLLEIPSKLTSNIRKIDQTLDVNYFETKLLNMMDSHKLLVEEVKSLIASKSTICDKLNHENALLTNEIKQNENNVKELAREAEELHKRILRRRSEHEVNFAEYSLLSSQYSTVQHYHSNLHTSCISTASYMKLQLGNLQTLLENSDNTEIHDMETSIYDDLYTPKKPSSSIASSIPFANLDETPVKPIHSITKGVEKTNLNKSSQGKSESFVENIMVNTSQSTEESDNISKETQTSLVEYKNTEIVEKSQFLNTCDANDEVENFHSDLSEKCEEIKRLSDLLVEHESIKEQYIELQKEYDSLSTELMDSLQEADDIRQKYKSLQTEMCVIDECSNLMKQNISSTGEIIPEQEFNLLNLVHLFINHSQSTRSELASATECINRLEFDLASKQEIIDANQSQMSVAVLELQKKLEDKHSDISILNVDIMRYRAEIANISQHLESSNEENQKYLSNIEKLENDISTFTNNMEKLQESERLLTFELKELAANKDTLNSCIFKLEGENLTLHEKITSLLKQMDAQVSEIELLKNTVDIKQNSLNTITEKYEALCTTNNKNIEAEISILKQTINANSQENIKLKEELLLTEQNVTDLLEIIDSLKKDLVLKSNQIEYLIQEKADLNGKEQNLSQTLEELNERFVNKEKEVLKMSCIVSDLQSQLADVQDEKRDLSNKIKVLQNEEQTLNIQIQKCEEKIQISTKILENNDVLKSTIAKLHEDLEKANKDLDNLNIDSKKKERCLLEKIENLNAQIKSKQESIEECNNKVSLVDVSIKEKEELLNNVSHRYEIEKQKFTCQLTSLEKEVSQLISEKKVKEEERCSLLSNLEQLSCLLNEKDQEINGYTREISNFKASARSVTSYEFENQKLLMELQTQKESTKDIQEKLSSSEEMLKKHIEELESRNSHLLSTNFILENRVTDLQFELESALKSPVFRKDLHLKRQSLHDLKRNLVGDVSLRNTADNDNDVSMEDCSEANQLAKYVENIKSLESKLNITVEQYTQLEKAFNLSEKQLDQKNNEYSQIVVAYEKLKSEARLQDVIKANVSKQDASTNTNPEDKGALMSLFVDKMTYDFLNEKYKALQKANEDLRIKTKHQATELRRLEHSLQNNTLHKLLPHEGLKKTEKLQEELAELREKIKEKEDWKSKYTELKSDYQEMDGEYNVCVDDLKEAVASYNQVYNEKKDLEREIKYLKGKLDDIKEMSPSDEVRKKRQSLYDARRGTSLTTQDASTNTDESITNREPKIRLQPCSECASTQLSLQEQLVKSHNLESQLNKLHCGPEVSVFGSPANIIQKGKLHDFIKENELLKLKLNKYKEFYLKQHRSHQKRPT